MNNNKSAGLEVVETGLSTPTRLSISSLAQGCDKTLQTLSQVLPTSPYHELSSFIGDELGRYQVWAGNIGALRDASSKSSLESRLEVSELIRKSVELGLERLQDVTNRAVMIVCGQSINRSHGFTACSEKDLVQKTVEFIKGKYQDADSFQIQEQNPMHTTEISELFLNISSSITNLFTLSMYIRRNRPRGRTQPNNAEGLQIESGPDITNTKDKFPKLKQSPWLAERIGNWIATQREYIRYRQLHRNKLERRKVERGLDGKSVHSGQATTWATSFQSNSAKGQDEINNYTDDFTNKSMISVATSFATTAPTGIGSGRRIYDLPNLWLDGVRLQYGTYVECPYCRTIQFFHDKCQWKRHVYSDLQLYVCTFKDCDLKPFSSSHEWFKHEMECHRRHWICPLCSTKCESSSSLDEHFVSRHDNAVPSSQRKIMVQIGQRAQSHFEQGACVFCDKWLPLSMESKSSSRFRSHLEKHLQELARSAIPLSIDGLEIKTAENIEELASDDASEGDDQEEEWEEIQIGRNFKNWFPDQPEKTSWRCLGLVQDSLCNMQFSKVDNFYRHYEMTHNKYDRASLVFQCRNCETWSGGEQESLELECPAGCPGELVELHASILLEGSIDKKRFSVLREKLEMQRKLDRKDAKEASQRRVEYMRKAHEEAKRKIERAKEEAEHFIRDVIEGEREAEEEKVKVYAAAMQQEEEAARKRFETEIKALEEREAIEAKARKEAEEAAQRRLEDAIRAAEAQKLAAEKKAADEAAPMKQIQEDATHKAEADATKKAEEARAAAAAKAEADAKSAKEAEELKKIIAADVIPAAVNKAAADVKAVVEAKELRENIVEEAIKAAVAKAEADAKAAAAAEEIKKQIADETKAKVEEA